MSLSNFWKRTRAFNSIVLTPAVEDTDGHIHVIQWEGVGGMQEFGDVTFCKIHEQPGGSAHPLQWKFFCMDDITCRACRDTIAEYID